MNDEPLQRDPIRADDIFVADGSGGDEIPIWVLPKDGSIDELPLSPEQRAWAKA